MWPAEAIKTATAMIPPIIVVILGAIWMTTILAKKSKATTNNEKDGQPTEQVANVQNFDKTLLNGPVLLALRELLCLTTPTSTSQHGYMWHSAELICNKNNQCHLEYFRELLFNLLCSMCSIWLDIILLRGV